MVVHICAKCNYSASSKRDLQRHLDKKYPCDKAHYKCSKCSRPYHDRGSMYEHQKECQGRPLTTEELKQHLSTSEQRVQELEARLKSSTIDDDESFDNSEIPKPDSDINIKTIIGVHPTKVQLYFIKPGPLLKAIEPIAGTLIKFGYSDEMYERFSRHYRDFGGAEVLDSLLSNNAKKVEAELKKWMRMTGKLVSCQTENKKTRETEVFAVTSQQEYEEVVRMAQQFAKEYEEDVETISVLRRELQIVRDQLTTVE